MKFLIVFSLLVPFVPPSSDRCAGSQAFVNSVRGGSAPSGWWPAMGGIMSRTAKEMQAEWQEAKVVRLNTVVNVATLAELASKPLPVRRPSLPRVVLHECAYERLYVENEPSNVMYPSNMIGLPEFECECALREASAGAETTWAPPRRSSVHPAAAKATVGLGAPEGGGPAGSGEGREHLHSHIPALTASSVGAWGWGAEPVDSPRPSRRGLPGSPQATTPRKSILRRTTSQPTSPSAHVAQDGEGALGCGRLHSLETPPERRLHAVDEQHAHQDQQTLLLESAKAQHRNDVLQLAIQLPTTIVVPAAGAAAHGNHAVNAGGEERAEQTGGGAHGVLAANAGGEEQAPYNDGGVPRPRQGLVHVASLQAWGNDLSREFVKEKLHEVQELPEDASGESQSWRRPSYWNSRSFSFAEERVSPAAATSTSSNFSFTSGCGESNTGDAVLPQEVSAVTARTITAPDEPPAQAVTVDVSAR